MIALDDLCKLRLLEGWSKITHHPFHKSKTLPLEENAQRVLSLLEQHRDKPTDSALAEVREFLIAVEVWKMMYDPRAELYAGQNPALYIWRALRGSIEASTAPEKLRKIMRLKGFGSFNNSAKVASAVFRFLWPEEWGVVDWRNAAMLILLDENGWDVNGACKEAKSENRKDWERVFKIIDAEEACNINEKYREVRRTNPDLPLRAADVDMALFGLSLEAWPIRSW